jgi:hypothetical protein
VSPTLDLLLPLEGFSVIFQYFTPDETDGAPPKGIGLGMAPLLMLSEPRSQIFCESGVIGSIDAEKDIDGIGHG